MVTPVPEILPDKKFVLSKVISPLFSIEPCVTEPFKINSLPFETSAITLFPFTVVFMISTVDFLPSSVFVISKPL